MVSFTHTHTYIYICLCHIYIIVALIFMFIIYRIYIYYVLLYCYGQIVSLIKFLYFDVLLTVHLSIFISVINQLDAQHFLFYNKFISCLYMFWHMCSSSGGQNCITQPLVSSHCNSYLHNCILVILDHSLLSVWWYQRLCNGILTSSWWAQ